MVYLTCTMIFSVDLAHYRVACAKNWKSVDSGTIQINDLLLKTEKPMPILSTISFANPIQIKHEA